MRPYASRNYVSISRVQVKNVRGREECPHPVVVKATTPVIRPVPTPKWAISDQYVVKGFPLPPKNPGEKPRFMRFKVPVTVVEVTDVNGPVCSGSIKMSRSENTLTVTHRGGNKSSFTPPEGRAWLVGFFGTLGEALSDTLNV